MSSSPSPCPKYFPVTKQDFKKFTDAGIKEHRQTTKKVTSVVLFLMLMGAAAFAVYTTHANEITDVSLMILGSGVVLSILTMVIVQISMRSVRKQRLEEITKDTRPTAFEAWKKVAKQGFLTAKNDLIPATECENFENLTDDQLKELIGICVNKDAWNALVTNKRVISCLSQLGTSDFIKLFKNHPIGREEISKFLDQHCASRKNGILAGLYPPLVFTRPYNPGTPQRLVSASPVLPAPSTPISSKAPLTFGKSPATSTSSASSNSSVPSTPVITSETAPPIPPPSISLNQGGPSKGDPASTSSVAASNRREESKDPVQGQPLPIPAKKGLSILGRMSSDSELRKAQKKFEKNGHGVALNLTINEFALVDGGVLNRDLFLETFNNQRKLLNNDHLKAIMPLFLTEAEKAVTKENIAVQSQFYNIFAPAHTTLAFVSMPKEYNFPKKWLAHFPGLHTKIKEKEALVGLAMSLEIPEGLSRQAFIKKLKDFKPAKAAAKK